MIVIPAVIPQSFEDLESHLVQMRELARTVQIDITDGRLTTAPSWPYVGGDLEFREILAQERGMPLWESFDFEIDLMVLNPAKEYEQWIDAGASRVIFHYKKGQEVVLKEIMAKTRVRGVDTGLALHLSDPIEAVKDFIEYAGVIQLMGIERIGFQGEPFDEQTIERLRDLKEMYPDMLVSVDGGVDFDSAPLLAEAGADRLIIGSAIFNGIDIVEAMEYFTSLGRRGGAIGL